MLGVAGAGDPPGANSRKLAEIIAAAVLAGDISLVGAKLQGIWQKPMRRLGDNRFGKLKVMSLRKKM
jgi:hydroxymethylglutaryl-CoA reductase (NADPH)